MSPTKNTNRPSRSVFVFAVRGLARNPLVRKQVDCGSATHHNRHGFRTAGTKCRASDYADEQLTNLQKRICLIEFLRLDLVIVHQGAPAPTKRYTALSKCGFNFQYNQNYAKIFPKGVYNNEHSF